MSELTRHARPSAGVHVATVGPVGRVPAAPGTAGSLVGVALAAALRNLLPVHAELATAALAAVIYACGVWAAGQAETFFHTTDPGSVVIDEVAGQLALFAVFPVTGWLGFAAGFVLFRAFDVSKPFPAGRAERLPRGWGIMTDDVVAGIYGALALFVLKFVFR